MRQISLFFTGLALLTQAAYAGPPPVTWGPQNKCLLFQAGLYVPQATTPGANPSSGYNFLYFKSDNHLYEMNSSGTETQVDAAGASISGTSPIQVSGTVISFGIADAVGTNIAGTSLALNGGKSTGTGVGGPVIFSVSPAGTTGTGVNSVAEVARITTQGVSIGDTTATAKMYLKQTTTSDTGFVMGNSNNARKIGFDYSTAGKWLMGVTGSNYSWEVSDSTTGGSGANWMEFGGDGPQDAVIPWPITFFTSATDGAVTSLSSFFPLGGITTYNGLPLVVMRNQSSTVNTLAGYGTTGSSSRLQAFFGSRHITQTSTAEVGEAFIANVDAGTLTEHVRIESKGQVNYGGAAYTVTCNGTSGTSIVGTDVIGRFTAPAAPGTSCIVTFAATQTHAPHCDATDETTPAVLPMVASTTTATITDAGLAVSHVLSFHCTGYF